jgi:putative peptidoglycan lipid II flippase
VARDAGMPAGLIMSQAVTVAGIVQLVWLAASCRAAGIGLRLRLPRLTPDVKKLMVLMVPGAIGTGVMQINLFINIVLASLLPSGAVSFLYYADRLNQLPLGVIGIAIGTALLPVLSRHVAASNHDAVRHFLSRALEFSLMLGLPAAVALLIAAQPIIHVLFERGAFGPHETAATAQALAAYAIGIPAFVIVKVLSAAFFARQDTGTPVRVAIAVTLTNAGLGLALIEPLGHVGIALATGITAWMNAVLLGWLLHRRGNFQIDDRLCRRAPRLAAAGLVMGLALQGTASALAPWLDGPMVVRTTALAALVGIGAAVYFAVAHGIGGVRLGEIGILLKRAPEPPGAA